MQRQTLTAVLLSTSLLAGGAWAQTADPAPSSSAPSSSAPSSSAPAAASSSASGKFVSAQGNSEFKASKFVGVDVYGNDNEKIGDISEILLDGQGNAKAVVIGVGGFLGIGQKNVAVPWSSVTWSVEPPASKSTASTERPAATGSTGSSPGGAGPMTGGGGATASRPPSATTRSPAEQAAYNGYPDHAKVQLSKAELNEAPAFKYVADSASPSGAK